MSILNNIKASLFKTSFRILRYNSTAAQNEDRILPAVAEAREKDLPVDIQNPFEKERPQCVLCKYDIEPEYKNVQLLSQFVSRFTGRVHSRNITGLCEEKQKKLELEISKARKAGLMPYAYKDPKFYKDPSLYNPEKPIRPHNY